MKKIKRHLMNSREKNKRNQTPRKLGFNGIDKEISYSMD
jgi:hypothetical protein